MRVTSEQIRLITNSIQYYLGANARIWLFGSRLDNNQRGGDLDLYVEAAAHPLMSELRCKMKLEEILDLPIDLIVRCIDDNSPIANIAKKQGIAL